MRKALFAVLATLVALAALVAGCGGDDGENTETLTKAEFIEQGDRICRKAEEQSEAEGEEFAEDNDFALEKATDEQLEEAVSVVLVPRLNQQADELEELGAPEGDEEQVAEIIASLEDAADEIEDDPGLVFDGKVLVEPGHLAEDYGFEVCGQE